MATNLSRRVLIGGAGVAAVALAVPATGAANDANSFPPEWHAMVAELHRLVALAKAAGDRSNEAELTYAAQRQPEPERFEYRPSRVTKDMTIAQIIAMPDVPADDADTTEWDRWKAEGAALSARTVRPAENVWFAALNKADAALRAVLAYPSTSPTMLAEKLCLVVDHYGAQYTLEDDDLSGLLADARRFTGREG